MTTDAVYDAQQAIRIVRSRATEWGIDAHKIGVLGFSAGAELAAAASLEYAAFDAAHAAESGDPLAAHTSRPDFTGLIYPGPTPFETMRSRKLAGPDHGQPDLMGSRLHGAIRALLRNRCCLIGLWLLDRGGGSHAFNSWSLDS